MRLSEVALIYSARSTRSLFSNKLGATSCEERKKNWGACRLAIPENLGWGATTQFLGRFLLAPIPKLETGGKLYDSPHCWNLVLGWKTSTSFNFKALRSTSLEQLANASKTLCQLMALLQYFQNKCGFPTQAKLAGRKKCRHFRISGNTQANLRTTWELMWQPQTEKWSVSTWNASLEMLILFSVAPCLNMRVLNT